MNDLQIFSNKEFGEVRTVLVDNEPMFCLADVCRILDIKNVSDCKSRLNEKGVVITDTLTNGGIQRMTFINESNFYKAVFQSRKENAERFTDWVTSEVLPTIRKNGSYGFPKTTAGQIQLLAQGYTDLEKKIDRIEKDMPLFGAESDELSAHVKRRGAFLLGGKNSEAYKDKTLRKRVFTDIYSQLKREFGLYDDEGHSKSYKALKRKSLADAHEFIDCYELPRCLQEEIKACNAQLRFEAV